MYADESSIQNAYLQNKTFKMDNRLVITMSMDMAAPFCNTFFIAFYFM